MNIGQTLRASSVLTFSLWLIGRPLHAQRLTNRIELDSLQLSVEPRHGPHPSEPDRGDDGVRDRGGLWQAVAHVALALRGRQRGIAAHRRGGIGVHVINAEGPLIDNTFVERLFDNILTGLVVESGVLFKPLQRVGVDGRIRGDLVNGFRALSVRLGGVYYFGPLRRTDQ